MLLKNATILIIDDDEDVLTALAMLLKSEAKEVVTEKNPNTIASLLSQKKFDLAVLDMNFNSGVNTGNEGIYWLNTIKQIDKDLRVVLITAYGDMDLAITALKTGASDFIVKPWKNQKLLSCIQEVISDKASENSKKWQPAEHAYELIGNSLAMQDVFLKIKKLGPTDANILILGENGTGKDLVARAIHEHSLRKNKPFVKVDVGALTATLFESELFGHTKGAFTDAQGNRQGRFETANQGTLFLDEIGNIDLQQQAKLLSVLQNRTITPLGSNTPIPVDIRLICATNLALADLSDENKFRKDLIYRINTVEILVPPLRYRDEDVVVLGKHFLQLYAEKYNKQHLSFDKSFTKKLKMYHFPGNVRELQYALERAVIMSENSVLKDSDLIFSPIEKRNESHKPKDFKLDTVEKNAILEVIEKNNGNISKSAKELGITRAALYRRLNKYGL